MTNYALFNIAFGAVVLLTVALAVRSRRRLITVVQTAVYVTLVAYPWDHFAIVSGAWTYSDPGLLLFRVPINDMIFILFGSLFSAVVLSQRKTIAVGSKAKTEAKDGRHKTPHNEID